MADYNFSDVASKVNAPQMNISDMLKMGYMANQVKLADIEVQKAEQVNRERIAMQSYMSDPKNFMTDNGDIDIDRITKAIPTIAPLTGADQVAKLTTLATNNTQAKQAKMNFDTNQRQVVASVYSALGRAGVTDPKEYSGALDRLKEAYPDSPAIQRYADAAKSNLSLGVNPQTLPQVAIQTANQLLTLPQQHEAFAPKATLGQVGGASVPIITKPSVSGEAPQISTGNLGGGATPTGTPTTTGGVAAGTQSQKLPRLVEEDTGLSYTGPANPINLNDIQKDAYAKGKLVYDTMPAATQAAKEGKQYVRKVEQYASTASGSGLYKTGQDFARFVASNPDLDILRKNIAGVMVQNANSMGLNKTDASRSDAETLSGSEKISPEALRDIMQRADAQFTATEMFGKALDKYHSKRGDVNANIHTSKFQNAWANNYDSRIFQLDNIAKSNWPEKVKEERTAEIVGRMSESEYKDFVKKAKAIHRLTEGLHQ